MIRVQLRVIAVRRLVRFLLWRSLFESGITSWSERMLSGSGGPLLQYELAPSGDEYRPVGAIG